MRRQSSGRALLASTALATSLCLPWMDAAFAAPDPDLIVSAPLPGETYTVTGSETWGRTVVGDQDGESGTLNIAPGANLQTGITDDDGTTIGNLSGSTGNVVITGPAANWTDIGSAITVGRSGSGSLNVLGGAGVTANSLNIGYSDGGQGVVTISGAGSSLTATHGATLGYGLNSNASLTVQDGGSFETVTSGVYLQSGSTLNVTGTGSSVRIGTLHSGTPDTWDDSDGWLYIGSGAVKVSDGAYMETDGTYVSGVQGGGAASMIVTGAGTVLDAHLLVYIAGDGNGTNGDGSMTVSDAATVTASVIAAGVDPLSTGTLLVTGAGTSVSTVPHGTFLGNVYAGSEGNGTIIVQAGASLTVANELRIGYATGSTGKLIIGAAEGEAAAAPGSVTAMNDVVFGDGGGQLVFNHTGTNYVFDNVIRGTNGEIRQIAGVTNLTGSSPDYFGTVSVLGGVLKVNGDLSGATATVSDGGTIGGNGTVGTLTVGAGGWVTPGNSIGTLHVAGDYTQLTGSTYGVELGLGGSSDLIEVGGTAYLGGTVAIAANSTYALGNRYTILTANDIVGSFENTEIPLSLFAGAAVEYSSDTASLEIQKLRSFASAGATANQQAVGGSLDTMATTNDLVLAVTVLQTEADAQTAYDALSGEAYASAASILADDSIFLRQAVGSRVWQSLDTGAKGGPANAQFGGATGLSVWAEGYGAWGNIDSDGNAASVSRDIGGFFAGVDGTVGDGVRVGLLGGYGRSTFEIDDRASSGDIDSYSVGGYSGARIGALGLLGAASYSWNDVSVGRGVAFSGYSGGNTGSVDIGTTQLFGEANWRFDLTPAGKEASYGKAWLEPFAAPAYVNLASGSLTETGSSSALAGSTDSEDLFYVTLGARAATTIKLANDASLTPRVSLGWQHAFGDVDPSATLAFASGGMPFSVAGAPIAEDTAVVAAGFDYAFSGGVLAGLSYSGQFGDGFQDNAVKGNLDIRF